MAEVEQQHSPKQPARDEDGDPDESHVQEEVKTANIKKLELFLGRTVRLTLSDSRLVQGNLVCIDNLKNFVITDCQETRISAGLPHSQCLMNTFSPYIS